MSLDDVLRDLIVCLSAPGDCVIGWEQIRRWPKGALDVFQKVGWLKPSVPSTTVECPGCEERCFMSVEFAPAPPGEPPVANVVCDRRTDMGKVKIPRSRLQQWQLSQLQFARWVSDALHLRCKPQTDTVNASFLLGSVQGKQRLAEVHLDFNEPVSLKASGHMLPLSEIAFVADGQPCIDRAAIVAMVDLPPVRVSKRAENARKHVMSESADQEVLEVGSPGWREQTARKAANALHSKPGGSRDKQRRIRLIWATGKYPSRDLCADKEYLALGMSYSAARKALRNTPDP